MPYDHTIRRLDRSAQIKLIYNKLKINETKEGLKFSLGGVSGQTDGISLVSESAFKLLSTKFSHMIKNNKIMQIYGQKIPIVFEHVCPVSFVVKILLDKKISRKLTMKDVENAVDLMKYAVITKDEDRLLTCSGYRSKMPLGWKIGDNIFARYENTGIKLHKWTT